LGKIELLDRYTETPGPGVAEGTIKSVETNTPTACFREGRPTIISIARLGWRKRSRIPSKITRLLMPESAPTHLAKVGGEGSNPGVDFGFNVGLAEFEKSTCCGKRVPRHFRFQSRLKREGVTCHSFRQLLADLSRRKDHSFSGSAGGDLTEIVSYYNSAED
jgi:hypothetical protein